MKEMDSANGVKLGLPLQSSLHHDAVHHTRDMNQLAGHPPCQCLDFLMGEMWLVCKNTRVFFFFAKQCIEVQFCTFTEFKNINMITTDRVHQQKLVFKTVINHRAQHTLSTDMNLFTWPFHFMLVLEIIFFSLNLYGFCYAPQPFSNFLSAINTIYIL